MIVELEAVQDPSRELAGLIRRTSGRTQRLEGSQTPPRRLDSGRLRRAARFGACPMPWQISYIMRQAEKRAQQAAPANNPELRNVYRRGERMKEASSETSRWVIPGSRLFSRLQVRLGIGIVSIGSTARTEAAPLQAFVSDPGVPALFGISLQMCVYDLQPPRDNLRSQPS